MDSPAGDAAGITAEPKEPAPQKHYCGIVHDYGDSDQIMDGKFNPYWASDAPPKDLKGLRASPLLRDGRCLCVEGLVKAYQRAGKRAYEFTELLGTEALLKYQNDRLMPALTQPARPR